MIIDRAKFYGVIRKKMGPLTKGFVEGTEFILDEWERTYHKRTSVPQFAVCLATTYHETAHTMKPIREIGNGAYFTRLYGIEGQNPKRAREMGNVHPGDGPKYNGKGYVQLTWFVNYQKATIELRKLKLIDAAVDFTKNPELVMQPRYAAAIMFIGMEEGWFTGQKLDAIVDDEIDGDEFADFKRSRKIINGADRDELIAGYAMTFLAALVASVDPRAKVAPPPVAPPAPVVVAEKAVPGASAWNRFWTAVAELANPHNKS